MPTKKRGGKKNEKWKKAIEGGLRVIVLILFLSRDLSQTLICGWEILDVFFLHVFL